MLAERAQANFTVQYLLIPGVFQASFCHFFESAGFWSALNQRCNFAIFTRLTLVSNPIRNSSKSNRDRYTEAGMKESISGAARVMMESRSKLLLLLVIAGLPAYTATLSGTGQSASAGDGLSVPLSLASGAQPVSGIQFDLVWDPTLDVHVLPGAQAGIANKTIYAAFLQPRVLRCLIVGMNRSTVADGELIRLVVAVNPNAPVGSAQVNLLNLTAAGPDGTPVFLQGGTIPVQIQSGGAVQSIQPSGVVSGASLMSSPISPGEIVTLMGSIAPGSSTILFNGVAAPVLYAGLDQINAVVPFGLDLRNPAQVQIRQNGSSATTSVPVAAAAPAIFTVSTTGIGPGAILNENYSVNSVSNPANPGSAIMIYGTGFGALNPLPADGQIAQTLATTSTPVTATIDGAPAQVLYAGAAPQLINGVVQVNVLVPAGAHPNPAAPIMLTIGSFSTQPGVTVAIR